jgi:Mn2+/Fe2+ NRAMP family transporter
MDASRGGYDEAGQLVCARCLATDTVATADTRMAEARNAPFYASIVSALFGVLGVFCCVYGWTAGLVGVLAGAASILSLLSSPDRREGLGKRLPFAFVLSAIGILAGLLSFGLALLGMAAAR